jgi:hypothetical protein
MKLLLLVGLTALLAISQRNEATRSNDRRSNAAGWVDYFLTCDPCIVVGPAVNALNWMGDDAALVIHTC